jgi:hypothetical protein
MRASPLFSGFLFERGAEPSGGPPHLLCADPIVPGLGLRILDLHQDLCLRPQTGTPKWGLVNVGEFFALYFARSAANTLGGKR